MKTIVLTLVLLGGVAAGPVLAEHTRGLDGKDGLTAAPAAELPRVLEGRVLAVDHDRGEFTLATDAGTVTLTSTPEDVADLEVGDIVVVAFGETEDALEL